MHYAYAGKARPLATHGDIYYVRSTDNGATWSTPIKLNDDTGGQFKTQWMPSLSVNYNPPASTSRQGHGLLVRPSQRHHGLQHCHRSGMQLRALRRAVARQRRDLGCEFRSQRRHHPSADQNDAGVQSCYAGDYDYNTARQNAYVTWTDGRVAVGGVQVQSVEFATVPEP